MINIFLIYFYFFCQRGCWVKTIQILLKGNICINPVGTIAKKQSEGVHFCQFDTQNIVPYCQKYTPTAIFPTGKMNKETYLRTKATNKCLKQLVFIKISFFAHLRHFCFLCKILFLRVCMTCDTLKLIRLKVDAYLAF